VNPWRSKVRQHSWFPISTYGHVDPLSPFNDQISLLSSGPSANWDAAVEQDEATAHVDSARAMARRPRVGLDTPRERKELDPGSACPDCGGELRLVGEDVSEILDDHSQAEGDRGSAADEVLPLL
jgi:hypothetical protein